MEGLESTAQMYPQTLHVDLQACPSPAEAISGAVSPAPPHMWGLCRVALLGILSGSPLLGHKKDHCWAGDGVLPTRAVREGSSGRLRMMGVLWPA